MKLSVVIPAHNEAGCIAGTVRALADRLVREGVAHEIVVAEDHSTDDTAAIVEQLSLELPSVRLVRNRARRGFGMAVRTGLEAAGGDAVAVVMADASDDPADVARFFQEYCTTGVDCVFGTRFHKDAVIRDYPPFKLLLNRLTNRFIQLLFGLAYNDVTNAFKLYGRHVLEGLKPYLSVHFNLTVELPLKAIVRGYTYTVLPNSWTQRKQGASKLRLKEMGSRYLFIILYCFLERWLTRGDYRRELTAVPRPEARKRAALR